MSEHLRRNRPVFLSLRYGSAIMIGILAASVFFMFVSSLLHFLSGERKQVRHVIGKNQAEVLALSGIDWADQELRKGRWYQSPWGSSVTGGGRPTFGVKEMTPFGSGQGHVTVVCEDVPCREPTGNLRNMQQLWLLHHINVFALGEYGGAKCLLYGRFIMSPEPALNDDSTDAVIYTGASAGNPRFVSVKVPSGGAPAYRVKKLLVGNAENIDINKVVALLEAVDGSSDDVEVRPPSHGRVVTINKRVDDTCSPDDTLMVLSKKGSGGGATSQTLKRMVRITRLPPPWENYDITSFSQRHTLSAYVTTLSEVFLMNFAARTPLSNAIAGYRPDTLPPALTAEELVRIFPPHIRNVSSDRAENEFIAHIVRQFTTAPGRERPGALKKTHLELDHPKMDVPPALYQDLQKLNLLNLRNTRPRLDGQYFEPQVYLDRFIQLLSPHFNVDPQQFMETLSQLPDASRWIEIRKDPGLADATASTVETSKRIDIVRPDDQVRVTVEKITKSYDFVDPTTGFAIPAEHLLNFARKYYDDKNSVLAKEERRTFEHIDWPLPDPPGTPPAPQGVGEWVWIPGVPGVPPGPPTWSYNGGKKLEIAFPSAGHRDFEPSGGSPDGGHKTYTVAGVVSDSDGSRRTAGATAPDGDGAMRNRDGSAPETGGDQNRGEGLAPDSGSAQSGQPATGPEQQTSMFPKQRPTVEIPKDGTYRGTAGPAGIPPTQGNWAWTEPCPCGGSPAGGGGEGGYATGGTAPGQGQSGGSGLGGETPQGTGDDKGQGTGSDGGPGRADGQGLGADGRPGGADGYGVGADGRPGQADGFGQGADGRPGQAAGNALGSPGQPGRAGESNSGVPGGPTAGPGGGTNTNNRGNTPSSPGGSGSGPVYTCPSCGKLHKTPGSSGGGNSGGGGSRSSSTSGGC